MLYVAFVLGSVCNTKIYQLYYYILFDSICLKTSGIGQPVGGLGHVLGGWAPCGVKAA